MEKPLAGSNPMLHFQIRAPSTVVRPPTTLFHGLVLLSSGLGGGTGAADDDPALGPSALLVAKPRLRRVRGHRDIGDLGQPLGKSSTSDATLRVSGERRGAGGTSRGAWSLGRLHRLAVGRGTNREAFVAWPCC